eukprot:CAMPEP_0118675432 /NCGR_PEP_ID=MMETSP0800-20121206/1448_1 /TAXON_ID=210618 ORGANISM="Striatella unipunctata, Strain CCMP2910" /NCGR_SAMPLE_ID=MMETSP0800 /ASSEMBLY_ACC=CAM_ASM_000638 /LENGTH=133 /DNA_ID=CAMNT_0006570753 /DNA_START=173 /DNA_END=574 /DNA_ORIENTATION=-
MYYLGEIVDPNIPLAQPPKEIVVPANKPEGPDHNPHNYLVYGIPKPEDIGDEDEKPGSINHVAFGEDSDSPESRRKTLKEVREHLDLLKEFEGVISDEELVKRKRELFLALPPAPPPVAKKLKAEKDEKDSIK